MTASLLYPSAFLESGNPQDVWDNLESIVVNERYSLEQGAIGIFNAITEKDDIGFFDFQKVTFNADYAATLQRAGFKNNLGRDLYEYLTSPQNYDISEIMDYGKTVGHYVIKPLHVIDRDEKGDNESDFSYLNSPVIYISSPFSVGLAASNIASKGDQGRYDGGYMMSYAAEAGYQDVLSGGIDGRAGVLTTEVFYPLSNLNDPRSIALKTGNKEDFVLFDGSHSTIRLDEGDDTAAPSAAAFLPSIQFGKNIVDSISKDSTSIVSGGYVYTGRDKAEFVPYYSTAGKPISSNLKNVDYSTNSASPAASLQSILRAYQSEFSGDPSSWYAETTAIKESKAHPSTISIGGQSIHGELGNDLLYGFDPLLYSGMYANETGSSNDANGILNLNFLNDEKINILWTPILLSGGEGQDTFMIGGIDKINLRDGQIISSDANGSTYYTLLGDKDSLLDVDLQARLQESWGKSFSGDTFIVSASYDYKEEVIQKGFNIDYAEDSGTNSYDAAQIGRLVGKAVARTAKALGKALPGLEAVVAVADFAIETLRFFSTPPSPTSVGKYYQEEIKQKVVPPGNWNQTINIPDWDPLDRFVIQTIPIQDPGVKQDAIKWDNLNFSIIRESNESMAPQSSGYTLKMESSLGEKKPIAFMSGLQSPSDGAQYGYETFNFFTGRQLKIDPLQHITYFGILSDAVVSNSENFKSARQSYVEPEYYSLQIDSDSSVFLWNSTGLRNKGLLNQYRSAASSIQIGVDTRSFGWYSDLKLDNLGSEVDLSTSTFNYYDLNSGSWKSVSLQEVANSAPQSQIAKVAAKAQFSYWTAQDTYADQLMNLSAADADNINDVEFYKCRDDGFVLDTLTGNWLSPTDEGYERAALSEENYARAFSVQQADDGSIEYIVEDGYKLSPFVETMFADGSIDYIFAYDAVHARDPKHQRSSMIEIEDSGIIRFEDVVGGDYDYNDVFFDPSRDPGLAALIASSVYQQ